MSNNTINNHIRQDAKMVDRKLTKGGVIPPSEPEDIPEHLKYTSGYVIPAKKILELTHACSKKEELEQRNEIRAEQRARNK